MYDIDRGYGMSVADYIGKIYHFHPVGKYFLNLFVLYPFLVVDQLLNALTGGSPRETISGRLNRYRNGKLSWLVRILEWLEPGHCRKWEAPNAAPEEVFCIWD